MLTHFFSRFSYAYFKKYFILFLLFTHLSAYGLHKETYNRPIAISLGYCCVPGLCLRHHHIRTQAYPFDWVITDFSALYKAFETDYENFFLRENLMIHPEQTNWVLDTYTNMIYAHDFPTQQSVNYYDLYNLDDLGAPVGTVVDNFLDYYDLIHDKYLRRWNRLKEALNSSNRVLLIRYRATQEEAILLRDLIRLKHPHANFDLVIINDEISKHDNWNELNIENYYISPKDISKYESEEWLFVLRDLELLP